MCGIRPHAQAAQAEREVACAATECVRVGDSGSQKLQHYLDTISSRIETIWLTTMVGIESKSVEVFVFTSMVDELLRCEKAAFHFHAATFGIRSPAASLCSAVVWCARWWSVRRATGCPTPRRRPCLCRCSALASAWWRRQAAMCERAPSPYAPPMWRRAGRRCARSALDSTLFEAAAMRAVSKDLMEMKVMEFKEELGVREEPVSGMDAGVATPAAARSRR